MKGIGDFFVKLFFNTIGLVLALLTLIYAISLKQDGAAWLATISLLSGILLVVLSVQEIRIILNMVFNQSLRSEAAEKETVELEPFVVEIERPDSPVQYSLKDSKLDFSETDSEPPKTEVCDSAVLIEESIENALSPLAFDEHMATKARDVIQKNVLDLPSQELNALETIGSLSVSAPLKGSNLVRPKIQNRKLNSENYQFFEVVRKTKADHAFGQLEVIDDIYKKIKPYLSGERGLIISGSTQARGPYAATLKQVLSGDKTIEQLICKNIYPDLDLLPDAEVSFVKDRKAIESILVGLWSDYFRIVILVEEWEEEFWRAVGRNVNDRVSLGQNQEWLTVPAIKRKRPISYQNLSRFEIFNNRSTE